MVELEIVQLEKSAEINLILGQAHFIKTVEDLYEVLVSAVPQMKFGLAFCESSGACKIRSEGNDLELKQLAEDNLLKIAAGHTFLILMKEAYPINVLNAIKNTPEVCQVFCATANPVVVVIAETSQGRGILGVIDGLKPQGKETQEDIAWRKNFLRKIGYKL
jgi:hypothetical protein